MASKEYLDKLLDVESRAIERMAEIMSDLKELHIRKNAGYAGKDNPDPWANFRESEKIGVAAFKGCMVRWTDKVKRVENLLSDPENEQVGESLEDTLMDLAAYSLIAICLMKEQNHDR